MVKDFENNFKNQSNNLDLFWCRDETYVGGGNVVVPPPPQKKEEDIITVGTDVKRGEEVYIGFLNKLISYSLKLMEFKSVEIFEIFFYLLKYSYFWIYSFKTEKFLPRF